MPGALHWTVAANMSSIGGAFEEPNTKWAVGSASDVEGCDIAADCDIDNATDSGTKVDGIDLPVVFGSTDL